MPKLFIRQNFQFAGKVYRTNEDGNEILTIGVSRIKEEIAKGKHPKTGKWLSGVLNHCEPADTLARRLILGEDSDPDEVEAEVAEAEESEHKDPEGAVIEDPELDPESEERQAIYAEFDRIGKAYDRRWKLQTLRNNLVKAKKETGE